MAAWYNENDAYAAGWLRNLINERLIAEGEVDTRSIGDALRSDARTVPLVGRGIPTRLDKLRAVGNAIDPRPAAAFIRAAMQCIGAAA